MFIIMIQSDKSKDIHPYLKLLPLGEENVRQIGQGIFGFHGKKLSAP
jgi:hypothetical protein